MKRIPDNKYLGTRNPNLPGKPYEWKTWRQVYDVVDLYARGKSFSILLLTLATLSPFLLN